MVVVVIVVVIIFSNSTEQNLRYLNFLVAVFSMRILYAKKSIQPSALCRMVKCVSAFVLCTIK